MTKIPANLPAPPAKIPGIYPQPERENGADRPDRVQRKECRRRLCPPFRIPRQNPLSTTGFSLPMDRREMTDFVYRKIGPAGIALKGRSGR